MTDRKGRRRLFCYGHTAIGQPENYACLDTDQPGDTHKPGTGAEGAIKSLRAAWFGLPVKPAD